MKHIVRAAALLLLLTLTAALFTACGSKPAREPEVSELTDAIDAAIGNEGSMIAVDEAYVKGAMKMDVSAFAGWCVKINATAPTWTNTACSGARTRRRPPRSKKPWRTTWRCAWIPGWTRTCRRKSRR